MFVLVQTRALLLRYEVSMTRSFRFYEGRYFTSLFVNLLELILFWIPLRSVVVRLISLTSDAKFHT